MAVTRSALEEPEPYTMRLKLPHKPGQGEAVSSGTFGGNQSTKTDFSNPATPRLELSKEKWYDSEGARPELSREDRVSVCDQSHSIVKSWRTRSRRLVKRRESKEPMEKLHKYLLKNSKLGRPFLANVGDKSLLKVVDEFEYFQISANKERSRNKMKLGVSSIWIYNLFYVAGSEKGIFSSLQNKPPSQKLQQEPKPLTGLEDQMSDAKNFKEMSPKAKNQVSLMEINSPLSAKLPERKPPPFDLQAGEAWKQKKQIKAKKPSVHDFRITLVPEDADVLQSPRRKCTSFDVKDVNVSRENILKRFKILRWVQLSDSKEGLVVIYNECTTLDIVIENINHDENLQISSVHSQIFSNDLNLRSLMSACIEYILHTYSPSCNILAFLSILFLIHYDTVQLYKQCKGLFPDLVIKVDRKGRIKVRVYETVEVSLDVFSDQIAIEAGGTPPRKTDFASIGNLEKRRLKESRAFPPQRQYAKAQSTAFNRSLVDALFEVVQFVKIIYKPEVKTKLESPESGQLIQDAADEHVPSAKRRRKRIAEDEGMD